MKMKSSLKKLRELGGLNNHHHHKEEKDNKRQRSRAQLDEIACASQDMQDMKDCYDSLLSAAAATANSAFEFSESLREMGACLLEKTALNDDEESGQVLLMLGKLQFQLQELVDKYRSHIFQTITIPSESLLNEIRIVEEMKRQCDEKRSSYEHMMTRCQDNKRSKHSKGESFSPQQVQAARDECDEEATLFVFRLKSLKQGQSRSLLTQAARHHASQLRFFRKALSSVESVEPHVQSVTEKNHIDYLFNGLEDENSEDCESDYDEDADSIESNDTDDDDDYKVDDHGELSELSFDYRQKDTEEIIVSIPTSSVEKPNKRSSVDAFASTKEQKASSQSAPLYAGKNMDNDKKLKELQSLNSKKFHSYVLPIPIERKNVNVNPSRPNTLPLEPKRTSLSGIALNYRHSSPLELMKHSKSLRSDKVSGPFVRNQSPVLSKETNENSTTRTNFPPPRLYDRSASTVADNKSRREYFSGPLIGKSRSNKMGVSVSGPIASKAQSNKLYAGGTRSPTPPPRPSISPSSSPPFISSLKISELHELPRPPRHVGVSCPLPPPPQLTLAT